MTITAIFATLDPVPMPTPWDDRYHELTGLLVRDEINDAQLAELDRIQAAKVAIAEGMGL